MALHTPSIKPQPKRKLRQCRVRSGFTLAESLIASVVLAVTVVAVSGSIVASQKQTAAQQEDATAVALARQLMEEITALPHLAADATCWPTVTNRSLYDRMMDYNGYTDLVTVPIRRTGDLSDVTFSAARPTVTVLTSGSANLSQQQYCRSVSVTQPTTVFGTSPVNAGDFAVVKVTVRGDMGTTVQLTKLAAKYTVTR